MSLHPAADLAAAIREHRDTKWHDAEVTDPQDLHLYNALVWYETVKDDEGPGAPILDA